MSTGLPGWAQLLISLSALVGAGALLWTKAIRPVIQIGARTKEIEARLEALERRIKDLEDG